jgi:glycosyltransferase involved in cell wall biosynthesis
MNSTFSIIIPAFDEQARLGETIKKILRFVQRENLTTELIVIDDGSNDATSEVAKKTVAEFSGIKTNVIRYEENRGKGYAVRKGLLASTGDIAIFSDADLSTPIEELLKLIVPIERGEFDVTFGSRALDRNLIGTRQSWRREQGGKVFNLIVRIATGLPFWDTQCGFKAFNMRKFRPLLDLMTVDRFGFDVEFLYVANYRGLRLKEIPVRWNHCDGTKVSVLRDSWRMFSEVRQIRKNAKMGAYNL